MVSIEKILGMMQCKQCHGKELTGETTRSLIRKEIDPLEHIPCENLTESIVELLRDGRITLV